MILNGQCLQNPRPSPVGQGQLVQVMIPPPDGRLESLASYVSIVCYIIKIQELNLVFFMKNLI